MKKILTFLNSKVPSLKGWIACLLLFFAATQAKATFTIWADTVSGTNGSQVDVSVKVREFTDIISLQGTFQWNVAVATYNSTVAYNLPFLSGSNFGTAQIGTGRLTFSWNDNNVTGITVPAGTTIFKIRFNLVGSGGSTTPVSIVNSPTPIEVVDLSFAPIPFVVNPGKIDVTGGGACAITNLSAGTQTACNPGTNTYTQQVTVTYNNAPGTGTLNVAGQSFAITSSPQTVTLTGLTANGAAVNVTSNFSASPGCALTANNLFTAPASCSSGIFKIFADSVSGNTGSQVDVPIRANEWTNLIAAQGTVSWNTSIATYNSMTFFGLPSMSLSNFGTTQVGTGKLTFSWNDPTLIGVTVPDSAIIFTIRFNIVGTPGSQTPVSFVNTPTPLEFTDNSFTVIPHTTRNGNIRVNGSVPQFKIFADSVQGPTLTTVDLPVRANDFNNLIAMQGTVDWGGTTVATYNSIPFFGLPNMSLSNFGTTQIGTGKLTFSWNDPTLVGVTVPDSAILFTVRYNLVGAPGAVTPVTFANTPTPLEFTDNTFAVIPHTTRNGQLKIVAAGNTITTGTVTGSPFCAGATFNLPFTITGPYIAGNVFTAQLSNASGSFGSPVTIGTLVSTTAGTIVCTIPGGTATGTGYRVRVVSSTPAIVGSDNGVNITINAIPATPTVSASGPLTFCAPGTVVLTSSSPTGNVWSPGGATTQALTVSTSGSYTVSVTTSGCTSAASAPVVVTVNAAPSTPTITPSGPTTFCAGGSVNLTSTAATSYLWSPGGSTAQSVSVSASGSYTVQVTGSNGCTATSAPTVVTVNALPATPTITPSGPTTFCAGGSVTLTSTAGTSYLWSPGGATTQAISATTSGSYTVQVTNGAGCTATSAPTVVTVNPLPATPVITASGPTTFCAGGSVTLNSSSPVNNVWTPGGATTASISATTSGTYSVVVNNGGCTSLPSNSITVTVNPLPSTPVITPSGPTTFCTGGSVTLTSTAANAYLWSPGGSTAQSVSVSASGSYTVQVTDANGCSATSAPTVVTVNPLPATPVITASGPTTFCAGGSVTLNSSSPVNNVWTPGGATTASISATTSGTYSVVVNNGGCTSLPSNSITVTVNPLPSTPVITPSGPTTFCTGGSVNLTSTAANAYLWSPGGSTAQSVSLERERFLHCPSDRREWLFGDVGTYGGDRQSTSSNACDHGIWSDDLLRWGKRHAEQQQPVNNVWTPGGATTASISATTSGTYSVVVNNGGCTSAPSNSITVTVNPLPSTPVITPSGPTTFCTGGSVTLTSTAANAYLWSPGGATTQTLSATTSGSYTVQVTDANGCSATSAPTVVTVNPLPATPVITASGPTTFCAGGSVTLNSSSPVNNVWTPGGATTASISATTSGTYSVVVNNGGCTSAPSNSITVTVNPLPSTPVITPSGPTTFCTGGSVTLTSTSANAYLWSPGGSTAQSVSVSASGSYTVQVTDANGCSATSAPTVVTVNTSAVTPTITPSGPTTFCTGGSVTLTSSVASGYVWNPGGATTQGITVGTSGTYTVQITDVNGCTATSAPTVVTVNPIPATPSITASGPTTFCSGGSVTLNSSSPVNNVWTPGGATTASISATTSGTYSVVVSNGGCTSAPSNSITVTVNPLPSTPTITPSGPTTFCTGGSVNLTSTAANAYLWSPGGSTAQSVSVSASGSYTVQVTDANGCSATSAPTVVTVNPLPATPTITASGPTTFCAGGSVTLNSSSPSNNVWTPGGATTASISVTTSGTYSVVVDNGGCVSAPSNAITVTVNAAPATPTISASGPTTFCTGGSVTLTAPLATSYLWSPGGATTQAITVSANGSYTVQVTNALGCSATSAPTVVTVNSSAVTPTVTPSGPTTFCTGGSVTLTSSAASGFVWSPGGATTQSINVSTSGSYSVQITDVNGCTATSAPTVVTVNPIPAAPSVTAGGPTTFCAGGNVVLTSSVALGNTWSPGGATTQAITVTTSGSYTVTQTVSGCTSPASAPTVVTVNPIPATPTISASGPTTFCAGGSVVLTSSSPTGNVWSPGGATTQSITVSASGSYSVQVTTSGCTSAASAPIVVTVNPTPAAPTVSASGPLTFCAGGNVVLTSSATSGNTWSPGGATTQAITVTTSGSYTVTETASGCVSAASAPVVVTVTPAPAGPVITPSGPTTFCVGGSVTLTSSASNGNLWSPGGATTQAITVNTSGTYTVTQTVLGCTSAPSAPVTVTVNAVPATPSISASGPTTFCAGGSVTLTSSNPSGNLWSPGNQTTQTITVTASGNYTVMATALGCSSATAVPVTVTVNPVPSTPTVSASGPTSFCIGGSVTLTSSSATNNTWSPGGATTQSITASASGSYTVQVSNGFGCTATSAPTVVTASAQPSTPTITPSGPTTFCAGGSVTLTSSSATNNSWSPGGQTSASVLVTGNGTYTVVVTNQGCASNPSAPVTITVQPLPVAQYTATTAGLNATFTDNTLNTPISWSWNFGDGNTSTLQNPTHTYAAAGSYSVCLTATNACGINVSCQTVTVCQPPAAAFSNTANLLQLSFADASTGVPTSWSWDFGDGGTSTSQNPSHTYAAPGTYNVCLTATNACSTSTSCQNVTVVCPPPVAGFSTIVLGFQANFTVQSTSTGTPTYSWDFGDGGTSVLFNPSHTYAVGGLYNVCLTMTTECGTDTYCDTISVACPTPGTDFSFAGNLSSMAFTDLSSNSPNAWAWDFGDGGTSTLQNPTHAYAVVGLFYVCLTATNDCGASTMCHDVDVISGVEDALEWSEVGLFPNPTRDRFTVAGTTAKPGVLLIEVTDLYGRQLIHHTAQAGANFSEEIAVDGLAASVYIVKVTRGAQSRIFRLVKE
ncbi:MAG: PKD domain-containing protein [Bacteroidetes bacterium]|nr:PKD domain-containing protein [Bacteroidota bacterium]